MGLFEVVAGCTKLYDMILTVMHWNLYETEVTVEAVFQAKTTV